MPTAGVKPVCGRKFCSTCGKWRLIIDFNVMRRTKRGVPLYFFPRCRTCTRIAQREGDEPRPVGAKPRKPRDYAKDWQVIKADPARLDAYREYHRFHQDRLRREQGVKPREFKTDKRSKGKPYNWGQDAVDSGPFLAWLEGWQAQNGALWSPGNPVTCLEDLAALAKCSSSFKRRAKESGRVSINVVDHVLIAAGGAVMLIDLYPELYPDVDLAC